MKDKPIWTGPWQVTRIVSSNVYDVRSVMDETITVHASGMWFYEPTGFVPSEELKEIFQHDFNKFEVERFLDIRKNKKKYEILTKWLGLEDAKNTWEPLEAMYHDLSNLVE